MISVLMNSYNDNQDQLKQAIEGYQKQTIDQDVQIIVSTIIGDPAINTAMKMGVHEVFQIIKPSIYGQINKAMFLVKGEYFCYASGNDLAVKNKLSLEYDTLQRTGKKVCYSAFHTTDKNLTLTATNKFHPYNYKRHLEGNFVTDVALVETKMLNKYLPFKEEFGNYAFWDLWLRIYKGEGDVFAYNPIPAFLYRIDGTGRHIRKQTDKEMWNEDERRKSAMLRSHGKKYSPRLR